MKTNFWDRIATEKISSFSKETLKTIEITQPYINQETILLDFGCGTGDVTRQIGSTARQVVGFDTSIKSIEIANKLNNSKHIQFTNENTEYSKHSFNTITMFNVLQYIQDVEPLIDHLCSMLQPEGTIIIASAFMGENKGFNHHLFKLLSRLKVVPKINMLSSNTIRNYLNSNGFEIIEDIVIATKFREHVIIAKRKQIL